MVNPVTEFIKNNMEPFSKIEANMTERVAETTINGQRSIDERRGPFRSHDFWKKERRSRDFDHYFVAHSTLKASNGGYQSSPQAMDYYMDMYSQRKTELLEKYGKK